MSFFALRETRFGPLAILWEIHGGRARIRRVVIPRPGSTAERIVETTFPEVRFSSCSEIERVAEKMAAFLGGEAVRFSLGIVRLGLCSEFQRGVLRAEHGIPRGQVSTYGRIAVKVGVPGASRAVGTALATNPFPIIVPCHRAIRSDGTLGGYQGGPGMKRALLEMEGIDFDPSGRILNPDWRY